MDAAAIEARLKAFFEEDRRGATAVYLFGSVARGDGCRGKEQFLDHRGAPRFLVVPALT